MTLPAAAPLTIADIELSVSTLLRGEARVARASRFRGDPAFAAYLDGRAVVLSYDGAADALWRLGRGETPDCSGVLALGDR